MKRFAFALGVTSCLVDVDLVYAKDSTLEERRLIPLTLTGGARKGGVFPTPLETKDFSRLILTRPQLKQNLLSAKPLTHQMSTFIQPAHVKPEFLTLMKHQGHPLQTLRSTPTQPSPSLKNLLLALTQPLSSGTVVPVNPQKPLARETTAPLALKPAPTQPSAPLKDFLLALTQPLPSDSVVPVNPQKPLAREITAPLALKPAPTQQTASLKDLLLALAQPLPSDSVVPVNLQKTLAREATAPLALKPAPTQQTASLKDLLLALAQPLPSVPLKKTETETTLPHLSPITSKSEPVLPFESKNTLVSPAKVENHLQETLLSILPIEENPLSVVSSSIVAQDIVSERLETTEQSQPSIPVLSKAFGAKEIQKNYGEEPSLQTPREAELSSSDPTLFLTVSDQPRNGDSHSFVEKSIEFLLPPSLETLDKDKNLSHEELAHGELSLSLFTTEYALVEQGTEFLAPVASKILEKGQEHQHTEHTHTTSEDLFILGERNLELLPPMVGKILESAQELSYEELRLGTALEDSPDIVPVFTQALPRQDVERPLEKSTPQPGTIKLHTPVEHDSNVLVPERVNTLNTDQEPLFEEFVHSPLKTPHTLVDQRDELLPPVASKILERDQEPLFEELGLDTILEDNSEIGSVFAHHFLNLELEDRLDKEGTPQHNATTPHVLGEQRDGLLTSVLAKTLEEDHPHEELLPITILTDKHEPDVFEHRNKLGSSHVLDIDVSPTLHPRLFTSLGSPVLKPQMPPSLGLTAGSTHLVRHTLKAHLTKDVSHLPLTHGTHDLVPLKAIGVNETLEVPLQTLPPVTFSTADVIQTQDLGLVPVKSQPFGLHAPQQNFGSSRTLILKPASLGLKIFGLPQDVTFSVDLDSFKKTVRRAPLFLDSGDSSQKKALVLSSGEEYIPQEIYTLNITLSSPNVPAKSFTLSLDPKSLNELASFVKAPLSLGFVDSPQKGSLITHRALQHPQQLALVRHFAALLRTSSMTAEPSELPLAIRTQSIVPGTSSFIEALKSPLQVFMRDSVRTSDEILPQSIETKPESLLRAPVLIQPNPVLASSVHIPPLSKGMPLLEGTGEMEILYNTGLTTHPESAPTSLIHNHLQQYGVPRAFGGQKPASLALMKTPILEKAQEFSHEELRLETVVESNFIETSLITQQKVSHTPLHVPPLFEHAQTIVAIAKTGISQEVKLTKQPTSILTSSLHLPVHQTHGMDPTTQLSDGVSQPLLQQDEVIPNITRLVSPTLTELSETHNVPLQTLPPVTLSTADVIQTQELGLVPVKSQALRMSTSQRTPGSMVSWTLNLANFGIKIPGAPREVTFSIDLNSLTKTSHRDPLSLGFADSPQKRPLVLSSESTFKVQTDQDIYTFDLTFSTPDVQSHTMTVSLNSNSFNELAAFVTTPLALKTSEGVQGELVAHRGVSSQGPQTLLHRLLTASNRGTASVTSTSPVPSWIRKTFEGLPTFLRGDSVKPTTQRSLTGSLLDSTSHPSNALVRGGSSQPILTLTHQVEEVVSLHSPQTYTPIPDILSAARDLGVSPGTSKTPVQTRQPSSLPLPQELVVAPAKQLSSTIDTPLTLDLATLGIYELPGSTLSVTPDSLRHASRSTDTDEEAYTVEATLSVPDTQPIRLPIVLQSDALQELTALMSAPLSEKEVSIPRPLSLKQITSPIALPEEKLASSSLEEQKQSEHSLDTIFAPLDLFSLFEGEELDDDITTVRGDHNKKEPFAIRTVSLDSPTVQTRFGRRSLPSVSTPLWTTHTDSPKSSSFEERSLQNTLSTTPVTPQRKVSLSSFPTTPETLSPARDYQPVTPDSLTNSPRDYGTPLSPNTLRLLREAATRIIEGVSHAQRFVSPVLNITPLSDKKSSTPSGLLSPARDTQPKTPDSILSPALNREPVTPPLSSSDKKSSTPSDLSPALDREPVTPPLSSSDKKSSTPSDLSPALDREPVTPLSDKKSSTPSDLSPALNREPVTPPLSSSDKKSSTPSDLSPALDREPVTPLSDKKSSTPSDLLSPALDREPITPPLSSSRKKSSTPSDLSPALNREPKTPDSVLSPARDTQPKTPDSVLSPARDTQPRTPDSILSPAQDTQPRTPDSVLSPARDTQPRTPDSVLSPTRKEGSGTRSLNKKKSKAPVLQPRTPNERNLTPESSSKASQKTTSPKVSPKFIKRKGKENSLILTDEQ
ncbi:MAG: hypothetical protein HYX35_01055 [Proteobacteria bacterium]|nr:hypothetical protein [Pseudomonadota bacterium]